MAVASFLAYSPILRAYGLNGYLLDINKDNPAQGYYYIFLIALISSGSKLVLCPRLCYLN